MKKFLVLGVLLLMVSLSVFAQGFYFDAGFGVGKGWTEAGGEDMVDTLKQAGIDVDEMAVDLGVKAGFGPFGKIPLYLVGEFGGMGHRIMLKDNYMQFNSYLIGPGLIFYPVPLVQLGASAGYSFVSNQTDLPVDLDKSEGGFAWNASAAIDLGKRNHGLLLGVKYFNANNPLKTFKEDEKASMIGLFIKYAYRKKAPSLFNKAGG